MDILLTVLLHGGEEHGGFSLEDFGDILLFFLVLVLFGGFGIIFLFDRWWRTRNKD